MRAAGLQVAHLVSYEQTLLLPRCDVQCCSESANTSVQSNAAHSTAVATGPCILSKGADPSKSGQQAGNTVAAALCNLIAVCVMLYGHTHKTPMLSHTRER